MCDVVEYLNILKMAICIASTKYRYQAVKQNDQSKLKRQRI